MVDMEIITEVTEGTEGTEGTEDISQVIIIFFASILFGFPILIHFSSLFS